MTFYELNSLKQRIIEIFKGGVVNRHVTVTVLFCETFAYKRRRERKLKQIEVFHVLLPYSISVFFFHYCPITIKVIPLKRDIIALINVTMTIPLIPFTAVIHQIPTLANDTKKAVLCASLLLLLC